MYKFDNDAFAGNLKPRCIRNSVYNSLLDILGDVAELEPVFSALIDLLHNMSSEN